MDITIFVLVGVVIFAGFMYVVTSIFHIGSESKVAKASSEAVSETREKSFLEKYCNDKENDNYKARAKWILDHDKNERARRGQE